jgi:hypothetical protein
MNEKAGEGFACPLPGRTRLHQETKMATFEPQLADLQSRLSASSAVFAVSIPATGTQCSVTITDPGVGGGPVELNVLQIIAGYSGAGSGNLTIAVGGLNHYQVSQSGAKGDTQIPDTAWHFAAGGGDIVITLAASGSTQGFLIVAYETR